MSETWYVLGLIVILSSGEKTFWESIILDNWTIPTTDQNHSFFKKAQKSMAQLFAYME